MRTLHLIRQRFCDVFADICGAGVIVLDERAVEVTEANGIPVPADIALCIRDALQAVCVGIPPCDRFRDYKFLFRNAGHKAMEMPRTIFVALRNNQILEIRRVPIPEILKENPQRFRERRKVGTVHAAIGKGECTKILEPIAEDIVADQAPGAGKTFLKLEIMLRKLSPIPCRNRTETLEADHSKTLALGLGILINSGIQEIAPKARTTAIFRIHSASW